jgi:hypothetical protein
MPKPVCVQCQTFYRPDKNGVWILEQKPIKPGAKPGLLEPELWIPYKAWQADRWKCNGCGHQLITGFGLNPMWQDFHSKEPPKTSYTVNDC